MTGGANEPQLLAAVYCVSSISEIGAAAVSHFHKDDFAFVHHDQIDFAGAYSIVSDDDVEPAVRQKAFRGAFRTTTDLGGGGRVNRPR